MKAVPPGDLEILAMLSKMPAGGRMIGRYADKFRMQRQMHCDRCARSRPLKGARTLRPLSGRPRNNAYATRIRAGIVSRVDRMTVETGPTRPPAQCRRRCEGSTGRPERTPQLEGGQQRTVQLVGARDAVLRFGTILESEERTNDRCSPPVNA